MPHIDWTAPSLMLSSLVCGILFALGHRLFYASLDHKHASTSLESYNVLGMHLPVQQFNTAVGTAFAFLVRACLMLSISIAYFQLLIWSVAKHGTKGTKLVHLEAMTSALQDLVSLASFKTWWRRPWLWVLAVVAWLIPISSIVMPATLSVGIDFPPPIFMNVPNVGFASLNLAAPMAQYGTDGGTGLDCFYAGPSLTVQTIAGAVAAQGPIFPVAAPSVNSAWDLDFNGPSLHCRPVSSDFRQAVLADILDYTFTRSQSTMEANCSYGPGYMAWHPQWMTPTTSMTEYLPFIIENLNSSSGALNNDNSHGYPYDDMASVFLAIASTLFISTSTGGESYQPTICRGKSWYQKGLAEYYNTSTVLRCDVHNSTYHTTFSFVNGVQAVDINNVTDVTKTPMITIGGVTAYLGSSSQTNMGVGPQACPNSGITYSGDLSSACLYDPVAMSTLSYQAVMHAFTDLVTGMISLGDAQDLQTLITSTTQLSTTVLADAPELAFLQSTQTQNQNAPEFAQQKAATWKQQPFAGLVNVAAAKSSTLPFGQALEQLFQNITISLMNPTVLSIYYPNKTEVRLSTNENIYIYAAYKLWFAYGLAVGATALITLFGIAAIFTDDASFSNRFSTVLRLSRGVQLSIKINQADLSGRDPLPAYAKQATVRFSQQQMSGTRDGNTYLLVDREGKDDEREVTTQERHAGQA